MTRGTRPRTPPCKHGKRVPPTSPGVKRSCYHLSTYAWRRNHTSQGMGGRDKNKSSSARQLEPKWHRSDGYCCNFLCAKHGYKQITSHPMRRLLFTTMSQTHAIKISSVADAVSLTLAAKRARSILRQNLPNVVVCRRVSQCQIRIGYTRH